MTPTRITCWSVLECERRARALEERSHLIVAELDRMAAELGMGPATDRCDEHIAVVTQLDQLHTLVEHCLANLRGGFALPPTPGNHTDAAPTPSADKPAANTTPVEKRIQRRSIGTFNQRPDPPAMMNRPQKVKPPTPTPEEHARAAREHRRGFLAELRKQAAAEGLHDLSALAARTGYTLATLQNYSGLGRLPPPHTVRSGIPLWHDSQLEQIGRKRRGRHTGTERAA